MKNISILLAFLFSFNSFSQDIEDDLFGAMSTNSLTLFLKGDKNKLTVNTYRNSKEKGLLLETTALYRKGKIRANKINFSIKYTEHYILEDRKKSVGNYQFDTLNNIYRYERSDYNNRNVRLATFYNFFTYSNGLVLREYMRIREYIGAGVEQDSVIYIDSVVYKIAKKHDILRQDNLSYEGAYTIYSIQNGQLISKTNYFEGFHEEVNYTYDSKKELIKIENNLIGADDQKLTTYTTIKYSIDGLITETLFYDEQSELLEKKVFTYK